MLTLIAATALVSTKFPGGTINDFASALSADAKQNVIVAMAQPGPLPAFDFDTVDLNEFSRVLRNKTQLLIAPGTDLVLTDGLVARALISVADGPGPGQMQSGGSYGGIAIPPEGIKDGKITFETKKTERLDLQTLQSGLSKPVEFHWFYLKNTVTCNVKDLPELDFVKWVAKAVGGRVLQDAKAYKIDLDTMEVKKRLVKSLMAEKYDQADKQAATIMEKKRAFRIACINAFTVPQFAEVLGGPVGGGKFELVGRGPLANAAIAYVQDMERLQGSGADSVMKHVDHARKAYLSMTSKFQPSLEIPVLDEDGKPGGVVRF